MQPDQWLAQLSLPRFHTAILRWYDQHGRDLPWRNCSDPYPVWVSEIMLQQTQVATVLRYFEAFLTRFPTIEHLAAAQESAVLHAWQGLGYYRRARNLHQAARLLVAESGAQFPLDAEAARRLPGLGRYTANAILCFSKSQPHPILEANTVRLWTRLAAAEGDPAKAPLHGQLWQLAANVLPAKRPGDFNQALMDLGSQVCTSVTPQCADCPVQRFCAASALGLAERFPEKAKKPAAVDVDHVSVVLRSGASVAVTQCPADGRWANLWEFPRVERRKGESLKAAAQRALTLIPNASAQVTRQRLVIRHGIMHYRVTLYCYDAIFRPGALPKLPAHAALQWIDIARLGELPFSSPQRKIVRHLEQEASEKGANAKPHQPDRSARS